MHRKRILSLALAMGCICNPACLAGGIESTPWESTEALAENSRTQTMEQKSCKLGYLKPHGWSLQAQGGVNPIIWGNRDDSFWVDGNRLPSFLGLFQVPWIVGGKVGYNVNSYSEIYIEGDYTQAHGKADTITANHPLNGPSTFVAKPSTYSAYAVYGGDRYYFGNFLSDSSSCRASVFVGLKVGFVHHNAVHLKITENSESGVVYGPFEYQMLYRDFTISAGGNLGLDVAVMDCLSVVLTLEALGNGPARSNYISA